MPIYYLDTSAVMKRYIPETGSDVMEELFDGLTDSDELTTSYLTLLEVSSTATRLLNGRVLTQQAYENILDQFTQDIPDYGFTFIPVQNELIDRGITIAREYSLRSLDAIHFTSTLIASCMSSDSQDIYMVSSDRELIAACEAHGILTLNPQSSDSHNRLRLLRGRIR